MIRPIQMTNEIISDTKVIFARGNAVIQFAHCGCSALPVELKALEGVARALGPSVSACAAREPGIGSYVALSPFKSRSGRDRLCRPDHASNWHSLSSAEALVTNLPGRLNS
jgi:hypothetical protein